MVENNSNDVFILFMMDDRDTGTPRDWIGTEYRDRIVI